MNCSATPSRARVATPGRTASSTRSMVLATMRPARRIFSISSGDFRMITAPTAPRGSRSRRSGSGGSRQVREDGHRPLGDPLLVAVRVDLPQQAPLPVVLDQRLGVPMVDLQPVPDGGLVVVVAVHELPAAEVAYVF